MKAVIVLTLLVHLSQVVEYVDGEPQLMNGFSLFGLQQCFPIHSPLAQPSPPPSPSPSDPVPPPQPPTPTPSQPAPPPPPDAPPSPTDGAPAPSCSELPSGVLAILLDIMGNLMNMPKGTLSKVPLCCKRPIPSEPKPEVMLQSMLNPPQSPNPAQLSGPVLELGTQMSGLLQVPITQLSIPCFPIPLPPEPPPSPSDAPPSPPDTPSSPPGAPTSPPDAPPAPPCSELSPGALEALLDIMRNLLNMPKGNLSKVPLRCKPTMPSELGLEVSPLSMLNNPQISNPAQLPGPVPDLCTLTPEKLQMLIAQLATPQALDSDMKIPFSQAVIARSLLEASHKPSPPIFIPPPPQCVTHHFKSCVQPVVDECVQNIPVYQNTIRSQVEHVVKHIPVLEKRITNQEESFIRHVPITQKFTRPVVETRTRHIPVIRKRIRTVVEPYTCHVPVLVKYTRPIEETMTRIVPVVERRCRPVVVHTIRRVPITEMKIRPIVESRITQVPVKQKIVKNFIEQRVKPVIRHCSHCGPCCNPCIPSNDCRFPPNSPPINPSPSSLRVPIQRLSILRPPFPPCHCHRNFHCIR